MKPGELFLEKYILGELTEEEKQQVESSFQVPGELGQRLEELRVSDEEILKAYTPEEMAAKIKVRTGVDDGIGHKKGGTGNITIFKIISYAVTAAAAALVLIFGLSYYRPQTTAGNLVAASDGISTERVKGLEPSLKIYRRTGDSAEIITNREAAAEKDLLQIEYIAGSLKYGVIFSIDGRGVLTMHYPTHRGINAELDQSGAVLLPYAYELDDAPGFERFFFVGGGVDFDVNVVLDAAYELASGKNASRRGFLDIPDNYYQTTILLRKGDER